MKLINTRSAYRALLNGDVIRANGNGIGPPGPWLIMTEIGQIVRQVDNVCLNGLHAGSTYEVKSKHRRGIASLRLV